jgi:hypothetical protein
VFSHLDIELSSRKVKHLAEAIGPLVKSIDTKLDCEAIAVAKGDEEVYQIAILLGARKKRMDSPETLARNLANLSKLVA